MSHPDPRFCVCGHHRDGHAGRCLARFDVFESLVLACDCQGFRLSPEAARLGEQALLEHREGVPTSAELNGWLKGRMVQ